MIRKLLVLGAFLFFAAGASLYAQSTMSDEQVLEYVKREYKGGTSQAQIVSKLMQRGVNIEQIRRVRKKYENSVKQQELGTDISNGVMKRTDDRTRKNNGEKNYDYVQMEAAVAGLLPDSLVIDSLSRHSVKREDMVFGHDIFNRKDLSFEPNMNIATPSDYRIGPGDVVYFL